MIIGDPNEAFWLWLVMRKADYRRRLELADANTRPLIKTEAAELDLIMTTYDRMVRNRRP